MITATIITAAGLVVVLVWCLLAWAAALDRADREDEDDHPFRDEYGC